MSSAALSQGDHRGMGGGVFLSTRAPWTDKASYRLPRFPALSRLALVARSRSLRSHHHVRDAKVIS